ncbi:type II toxin-antitoxin system RelE/ParE family toxin [Ornithinimicrobium sp. F0845]|uniref:type II toxin-antitoxin system RelE/ParE family toxin n=1 Tax=Ornithinimicrobium sp. F0845 TaxID=2926412 RepID=UPI001FF13D9E|nr:type II toxin-antitoxin system RelE/ParE family toxin [Ornithinimicrobium sp. F0845]MCK0113667.1 type II toxin-antitoxin system RelE/ParE family toxin [Ornithinimicrobium sp. F0845]
MTHAFEFHPEAQAELDADIDWYDDREFDLGGRFADAVRAAVDAAVEDPDAWAVWPGWEREPLVCSKAVTGFPYRVVYFVQDDSLTIVAVPHSKRRPGYWRERVSR